MTIMSDHHHHRHHQHHHQIANRLPDDLKRLIRLIMKTFYDNIELYLVMDTLCTYPCIREEDLAELLKLESKHIKQNIADLKKEKFLCEKLKMQTTQSQATNGTDGTTGPGRQTTQRIYYYYINYKMFVNVCKYKLDQMRINIENEETNRTNRASYCCTQCKREYSEFDMRDIFRTMICIYCGGEVEEDKVTIQNRNGRNLMQKYNEKLETIFDLLKSIEHIQLSDDLLEPKPQDISHLFRRDDAGGQGGGNGMRRANGSMIGGIDSIQRWSGDATRHIDPFRDTRVNVNINESESISSRQSSFFDIKQEPKVKPEPFVKPESSLSIKHEAKQEPKEEPMDLFESNSGLSTLLEKTKSSKQLKGDLSSSIQTSPSFSSATAATTNTSSSLDDTILKLLLVHEKKTKQQPQEQDQQQQQPQQQNNNHHNNHHHNHNHHNNHHHHHNHGDSNGLDLYDHSSTSSSSSIIIRKRDYNNLLHDDELLHNGLNGGGGNGLNSHDYSIDSILKDSDNYNTTIHKKRKLNGYYSDNNGYKNGYTNGYTNGHNGHHHHHKSVVNGHYMNGDHHHHQNNNNGDGLYNENDQHEQTMMDCDEQHNGGHNGHKINGHHRLCDENVVDCLHHHHHHINGVNGHHDTDEEMSLEDVHFNTNANTNLNNHDLIYKTRISNQLIDLDKVTPQLINKMTKQEKELYVNKCRQLYMAMYEL